MKPLGGAKPKPTDEVETPDVEMHDEVYFRHATGPKVGKVAARGKNGVTVLADGAHHKVKWEHFLGHKVRVQPDMSVVDQGVDGMIMADASGRRRYVHDPVGDEAPALTKSHAPVILIFGEGDALAKAMGGRQIKNRPGLSQKDVTDKTGKQTKRWVKTNKDQPKARSALAADDGTPKPKAGERVTFRLGALAGSGEIVGEPGPKGAHVRDESGHLHQVPYEAMKSQGRDKPAGEDFSAAEHGRATDDPHATSESILSQFPPETAKLLEDAQAKLAELTTTREEHGTGGYTPQRLELHRKIIGDILSPDKTKAATPAPGTKPVLTILGGSGGSGKSKFEGTVYDKNSAIVLDSDEIKKALPEYDGWNAHQVHEESSDIFDTIRDLCRVSGLNLVLDQTLNSGDKAADLVKRFQDVGYGIHAHFMHLPRQEAAKRAIGRFMTKKNDGSGRFVPIDVVLGMKSNEDTFDRIKPMADKWSFHDNNVPQGEEPKLIAKGGKKKG